MENLIKLYDEITKKLDHIFWTGFYRVFGENNIGESADDDKRRDEEDRRATRILTFWKLNTLIGLEMCDYSEYHDEMMKTLKEAKSQIDYHRYHYKTEDEIGTYFISIFKIALGKKQFDYAGKYFEDYGNTESFECDPFIFQNILEAAEYFDSINHPEVSDAIIQNLMYEVTERYYFEDETLYAIIDSLLYNYLIDVKPDMAAKIVLQECEDIAEYLDINTGDKLLLLANDAVDDKLTSKKIFDIVLENRRFYVEESSIFIWAVKCKILVCDLAIETNIGSVDQLAELVRFGIDNKITDVEMEGEDAVRQDVVFYASITIFYAIKLIEISRYKDILDYYVDFCMRKPFINEWINKFKALEYMGEYHLEKGEYLSAEHFYKKMIKYTDIERNLKLEGDMLAYMKLSMIHMLINSDERYEEAESLFFVIKQNYDEISAISDHMVRLMKRCMSFCAYVFADEAESTERIENLFQFICEYSIVPQNIDSFEDAYFMLAWIQMMLRLKKIAEDNYKEYLIILKYIDESNVFEDNAEAKSSISALRGSLYSYSSDEEAIYYLKQAYDQYKLFNREHSTAIKLELGYDLAVKYYSLKDKISAIKCLEEILSMSSHSLSLALRYFDEDKLVQMIHNTSQIYEMLMCYAADYDNEYLYNLVLKYKELKSYVVQVRNNLLISYPDDKGILIRIRQLREQITRIKTGNTFLTGEVSTEALEGRLEELEAEFEKNFPVIDISPKASSAALTKILKEDQAIIEYVRCNKMFDNLDMVRKCYENYDEDQMTDLVFEWHEYEAYIIRKINGQLVIRRKYIASMDKILDATYEFLDAIIIGNEALDKTELKVDLYELLVNPLEEYLDGVTEIVIAPTDFLYSVPFDILGRSGRDFLFDRYNIRYIECGRDLLKTHETFDTDGALLLGNPAFDYYKERDKGGTSRYMDGDLKPLPFSGIEVDKIAERLHCKAIKGIKATKDVLLNAHGYKYIHISTHGAFDYYFEEDPLFASCIFFAGAQNWLNTHIEDKRFGNGIVTADEISRLNLHGTELVVLSSCYSGMVNPDVAKGAVGLRTSFKSAGVRYIVMSQWELSDLATAIMLDKFYEYLKKTTVSDALRRARMYLRDVTIKDLKDNGWLTYQYDADPALVEQIDKLNRTSPFVKPFYDYKYWGAMTCMEC